MKGLLLSSALLLGASQAIAQDCIDIELALVADVSDSMEASEQRIQRQGYIDAFRSGEIIDALNSSFCGRMAVTYIEFSSEPVTVVEWMDIATDEDAEAFAASIEVAKPTVLETSTTGIARAIEHAAKGILSNAYAGERLVIDLSADGPDNVTHNVAEIRDRYTTATEENGWSEIVINGLPVLGGGVYYGMTQEQFMGYFETDVIGGRGAFVEPARDVNDIGRATLRKILREMV